MMTCRTGKDLVTGSIGRKTPQTEKILWMAALNWGRAWHTGKLTWASAAGSGPSCPGRTLKEFEF